MSGVKNTIFVAPSNAGQQHKKHMSDIIKSIQSLDNFTNNMQSKVDGILKAQEIQLVNAYKLHMYQIKEDVKKLQLELRIRDNQISAYENQGRMAFLLKRVNFLQIQQAKLLETVQKKSAEIKQSNLEKTIMKSEIKRMQQRVKDLIRVKTRIQDKFIEHNRNNQSIPTFSTEIAVQRSQKRDLSNILTQQRSLKGKMKSLHQKSQITEFTINPQYSFSQIQRLQKEVRQLRKNNRQLVLLNRKFMEQNGQMQNFFVETVNQIKKNISIRKQTRECSIQDFRKQDKLQLLIKILSNDDMLIYLHEKIFGKKIKSNFDDFSSQVNSSNKKINALRLARHHFPSLHSSKLG